MTTRKKPEVQTAPATLTGAKAAPGSAGGAAAKFTPIPTASAVTRGPCPALSSRMPATLPPFSSTSLGHFSTSRADGPHATPSASYSATAATKEYSAA